MEIFIHSPENEFENGTTIRVKTPHNSFSGNHPDTVVADQKNQQAFHIFLCIITILMGIIIGSIFHDRLLKTQYSQPVWKSSNLMKPDTN